MHDAILHDVAMRWQEMARRPRRGAADAEDDAPGPGPPRAANTAAAEQQQLEAAAACQAFFAVCRH